MSRSIPSLFDGFEDPLPEPSGKASRKIRSRKDNEAIPFSDEDTTSETKAHASSVPQEPQLLFEPEQVEPTTIPEEAPDADNIPEPTKLEAPQNDHLNFIHKELPSEPVMKMLHSVIVLEDIVQKKKELPDPEPEEASSNDAHPVAYEKQEEEGEFATEQFEEQEAALPEWDLEDKYYSIGEVAKLFQVNTSHIRFWTASFRLKPRTTRKGDRLYSKDDIHQLRLIHHLVKEKKHTIKGAQEKLKLQKQAVQSGLTLRDALIELKEKLLAIRERL